MSNIIAALGRFFFVLFCLTFVQAHAADVEAGLGGTMFSTRGDGIWYQQGLPHTVHLDSPSMMIGATDDLTPHLAWHLDAISMGTASANSLDVMDANYSPVQHKCITGCANLMNFVSSGRLYGIAATLEAHTTGDWQFGIEAGPWLFHQSWTVAVHNFDQANGLPVNAVVTPWAQTGDGTITRGASGWSCCGAVVGLTARHGNLGITERVFYNDHGFGFGSDPWPPIWRTEAQLMITYRF